MRHKGLNVWLLNYANVAANYTSAMMQECQRDVAHMEAEMNVTVQKNEKYLSDLRREVSDLRSRNDDLSQNLVCSYQ